MTPEMNSLKQLNTPGEDISAVIVADEMAAKVVNKVPDKDNDDPSTNADTAQWTFIPLECAERHLPLNAIQIIITKSPPGITSKSTTTVVTQVSRMLTSSTSNVHGINYI